MSERKPGGQQISELLGFIGQGLVEGKIPDELLNRGFAPSSAPKCAKCATELVELTAGDGVTKVQVCPACSKGSAR